jgi:hypothetical protein
MPSGTVFAKYHPQNFDSIAIKLDTWNNDFVYLPLDSEIDAHDTASLMEIQDGMVEHGHDVEVSFEESSRDGMFDENQLFAVWSTKDVVGLIHDLTGSLLGKSDQ